MTNEKRRRIVDAWIDPQAGLLSRFAPPTGFSHDGAKKELVEIQKLVAEQTKPIGSVEELGTFLDGVGIQITRRAKSRAWPLQSEFETCLAIALDERTKSPAGRRAAKSEGLRIRTREAARMLRSHGQIPSYLDGTEVCALLIESGEATYDELRNAHAQVGPKPKLRAEE